MKTTHTPGPWIICDTDGQTPHIVAEHGKQWKNPTICNFYDDVTPWDSVTIGSWYEQTENHKANARLIAAAPDLLAALQSLINDQRDASLPVLSQARAAIAKATGET